MIIANSVKSQISSISKKVTKPYLSQSHRGRRGKAHAVYSQNNEKDLFWLYIST